MTISYCQNFHNHTLSIEARCHIDGAEKTISLTGQLARTLIALVQAGRHGVTALEMSTWAYRLGAYVHNLRHDYGLEIETRREEHPNGWHARYVLLTPVTDIA